MADSQGQVTEACTHFEHRVVSFGMPVRQHRALTINYQENIISWNYARICPTLDSGEDYLQTCRAPRPTFFLFCARLDILSKVNNVVTLTSVNNLQASLATAQRRVEQGQNQVQRDKEQLAQSRQSLAREQESLSQTQRSSQQAQADAPAAVKAPQLDQAIKLAVPQQALPATPKSTPQLNSYGQTLGRLINVTA